MPNKPKKLQDKQEDIAVPVQAAGKASSHPKKKSKKRLKRVSSIVNLRTSHFTQFKNSNNETASYKSGVLYNADTINKNYLLNENFRKDLTASCGKIPGNRPITEVIEMDPKTKSPLKVITPGKTKLRRTGKFDSLWVFSNEKPPNKVVKLLNQIKQKTFIKKAKSSQKTQTVSVTPSLFKKHGPRAISQNKVMVKSGQAENFGSATQYVENFYTESFNNLRWEWLHLIAFQVLGNKSQTEENLVAGSTAANTNQLFAELELRNIANTYPDGFTLTVTANLHAKSQVAESIEYWIKTPHFSLLLDFDTLSTHKPHITTRDYFSGFIKALLSHADYQLNLNDEVGKLTKKFSNSYPFFSKKTKLESENSNANAKSVSPSKKNPVSKKIKF